MARARSVDIVLEKDFPVKKYTKIKTHGLSTNSESITIKAQDLLSRWFLGAVLSSAIVAFCLRAFGLRYPLKNS